MAPAGTAPSPAPQVEDEDEKNPLDSARRHFRIALQQLLPYVDSGDPKVAAAADCAMQGMKYLVGKSVLD